MREMRLGIFNGIGVALVGLMFALLLTGSAWALTATDCSTCHGADVVEGHHDTTDPNSYYSQGLCEKCHVGVTTGNDCSVCHQTAGYANSHHVPPSGQQTVNCASCHSSSIDPTAPPADPKVCSTCHSGDTPPAPIRTYHHTKLSAFRDNTGKLNCAICHPDNTLTSDCQTCHTDPQNPKKYQVIHHQYADANNKPCTSCHSQMVPLTGNCQDCHAPRAKMPEHHALTSSPANMSCGMCHVGIPGSNLPKESRPGCSACHAGGDNLAMHHDTVMPDRNLSCVNCHKNAVAISGCGSCHYNSSTPDAAAIHHSSAPDSNYAKGICSGCHTTAGFNSSRTGCRTCHTSAGIHHDSTSIYLKYPMIDACADCHNSGTYNIPAENCFFCHEGIVKTIGIQSTHHATVPATTGNCAKCHLSMTNPSGDCAACHSATGAKPATPQTHHAAATANSTPCANCHQGISKPAACTECHTTTGGSVSSRHHLFKNSQGQIYACDNCHSGASNIYQSCRSCHEGLSGATSSTMHHMTLPGQMNQCSTCHTGADATPLDCAGCHLAPGKPSLVTQHHATQSYINQDCARCHSATAEKIVCSGCHNGQNAADHHDGFVLVNNQYVPRPCNDCHKVQLAGGSCEACHTAPIPEIHHGAPLTAVSGNCGACHQTINDPSVCANCHTSSPHHATTWSTSGDCAHCHAVPASAADRAPQAACRECHGTNQHDKGGPIQNYGICAACHSQAPFHAAPTSNPGYTGYGAGKRKFNMFWSKFERRGDDIGPNGQDMNDEGGEKIKAQQLTFSTKSISHNGRSYTVPYFTGMPSSNLALNKTATASRTESGYSAALAVDGNVSTRWWAKSTSAQWLKIDLGAAKTVSKVALRWHSYYARSYQIQVSTDNSNWTTVFSNSYGAGGMETRTFTARSVRYIRINCQTASSSNGYSIYELEAFAK